MGRPSRLADYRACAEQGMTLSQAAKALGINRQSVCQASRRHGIRFKGQRPNVRDHLSDRERADYGLLMGTGGYRQADALRAIGRGDLL